LKSIILQLFPQFANKTGHIVIQQIFTSSLFIVVWDYTYHDMQFFLNISILLCAL